MFKKKILVIDDSELMVKLIHDILSGVGYDVIVASDGETGLKKVQTENPELVLLDGVMKGMSGFEVCRILREDAGNNLMPIIMLTARENDDDKIIALELGADDYIIKPFNHRELLSRVKNTFRRIDRNSIHPMACQNKDIEIATELNNRIISEKPVAVAYVDIDNFKACNSKYGFNIGDAIIKFTAEIIEDSICTEKGTDFAWYIGGDDFVIITVPDKIDEICISIIKKFDQKVLEFHSKKDTKNNLAIATEPKRDSIISISVVSITNDVEELQSHFQIAEILSNMKKEAKKLNGSNYLKNNIKHNI